MPMPKYKSKQIYEYYKTYREQGSQYSLVFAWSQENLKDSKAKLQPTEQQLFNLHERPAAPILL